MGLVGWESCMNRDFSSKDEDRQALFLLHGNHSPNYKYNMPLAANAAGFPVFHFLRISCRMQLIQFLNDYLANEQYTLRHYIHTSSFG